MAVNRILRTMGLAVAAMLSVPPLLAAQYSAIDLLGGSEGIARAINERGQIVGTSYTASGEARSFLWQMGVMTDLGMLPDYEVGPPQIVNPSFEADTFTVWPGDVWHNGPITGWGDRWNWGHGVNPGTFGGPFTDNGTIPDGTKAAFLQADGALNQVISGFSVGATYQVRYFENARNCCSDTAPFVEVKIGGFFGITIVAPHIVTPVGGSNPYREVISDPFVATSTELELAFIKSNPQGGDTTLLIDNVSITPGKLIFSHTYAYDINESGQIVGGCFTDQFIEHGFIWQYSYAAVINERGQIVGNSSAASGEDHSFLWQQGVMTDLGTLGGSYSNQPLDINEQGQIVGYISTDSGSRAVLWTK